MAVASYEEAAKTTWTRVVEHARRELPESSFSMWFQGVEATRLHDGVLEVLAPSEYVKDRLAKNYADLIRTAATEALGLPVRIRFRAAPPESPAAQAGSATAPKKVLMLPHPHRRRRSRRWFRQQELCRPWLLCRWAAKFPERSKSFSPTLTPK